MLDEASDDVPLEEPGRRGQWWTEDWTGLLGGVVGVVAGLIFCGQLVPGVSVNTVGFVLAFTVIEVPLIVWVVYLLATTYPLDEARSARRGLTPILLVGFAWLFVGPLVADQLTSDFNTGGGWQYLVLLAAMFLMGEASGHILKTAKQIAGRWH